MADLQFILFLPRSWPFHPFYTFFAATDQLKDLVKTQKKNTKLRDVCFWKVCAQRVDETWNLNKRAAARVCYLTIANFGEIAQLLVSGARDEAQQLRAQSRNNTITLSP